VLSFSAPARVHVVAKQKHKLHVCVHPQIHQIHLKYALNAASQFLNGSRLCRDAPTLYVHSPQIDLDLQLIIPDHAVLPPLAPLQEVLERLLSKFESFAATCSGVPTSTGTGTEATMPTASAVAAAGATGQRSSVGDALRLLELLKKLAVSDCAWSAPEVRDREGLSSEAAPPEFGV
jgi:hypothetical protein